MDLMNSTQSVVYEFAEIVSGWRKSNRLESKAESCFQSNSARM